ncbi:methyl-accepting chemotaxis protein II [Mangrovibacter phragmitis]|jgi:methyl-accepting chemotaxis protein-2 (aspartate sensor receptor)|uniref:Methyl-accepting chemotaxis protein II n=1 Tax=Mangrovibacter phragmitis TaxID=1691903 RepID=A0A1B7L8B1_9ENTR|nr:methyl-accepting chemotaxis protein [Mangrovibacter phragmitis]OAT78587.1 methyl-accepting chemotaxis protein II [Mangrovibacter phragmitis]
MFNRMRIVTLLMAVLGIFACLQFISGGFFFSALKNNQDDFATYRALRQQQSELNEAWVLMLQTRINLSRSSARMMMDPNNQQSSAKNALLESAKQSLAQVEAHYAAFKNVGSISPDVDKAVVSVDETYRQYHQALVELVDDLQNGRMDAYFAQPTQGFQNAMEKAYRQYVNENDRLYQSAWEQGQSNYLFAKWQMVALAVLLIAVIIMVWFGIRRILLQPLSRVIEHIREIAQGNLTTQIIVAGRNEITQLTDTVRHMQTELIGTVTTVRHGSDAIYAGTSEIAAGNTDLSSRTEQQASALEETAASMEELTATVKQNAENARQASQLALNASETAQKGGKVVANVVSTMQDISTSSRKIADITSVIDGIAFQTNILALNAAVEAARAGEQGRGFAVVAGEVRNLAQRSAQAAKEIKSLIDDSVSRVDTGSILVESAGETMDEIVSAVTRVTDIMGEIASASDEQSRGIDQVALAVSEMDRVTQQNASLVQESATAAAALEEQASVLAKAVAAFRLAATTTTNTGTQSIASTSVVAARKAAALLPQKQEHSVNNENWETF